MLKQRTLDISQTNIANLGSDLEKKVREAAAHGDPAWATCGKEVGLQIWRIEKFTVKAWPKNQYGSFYSGDSYIVLRTFQKAPNAPFSYDVHFWLGDHTTQDEYGTAAYKTVELDDYLKGLPVQHRETQGNESKLFLSYFTPPGLRIMDGGVESGFRHVKPEEYKPRLLHVKGIGNNIRVIQVDLHLGSLNSGDVFILDQGLKVFQFNGAKSAGQERMKAAQVVRAIDDERGSKVEVIVSEEPADDATFVEFWTILGGKGPIKTAEEGGSDKTVQVTKRLFQLSDASGQLTFTQVGEGTAVKRALLQSNDVFVLDDGGQIWAWVGKGASAQEKSKAFSYADLYLKKFNRPPLTPISRVLEGGENEQFEAAF
jgi:gelsolin